MDIAQFGMLTVAISQKDVTVLNRYGMPGVYLLV
jgi:hypothetical protein